MYITKANGRTEIGSFVWLLTEETPEPPPIGSVALAGPDAAIVQYPVGFVTVQSNYILPGNPTNKVMIVVTAVFSQ